MSAWSTITVATTSTGTAGRPGLVGKKLASAHRIAPNVEIALRWCYT